jgi:hypothetical protein
VAGLVVVRVAVGVALVAGAPVTDWLEGAEGGVAVAEVAGGTELGVMLDAVLAPLGAPAHAAVSMIIAARTIDRFMTTTLVRTEVFAPSTPTNLSLRAATRRGSPLIRRDRITGGSSGTRP